MHTRTVAIPEGEHCLFAGRKSCPFSAYSKRLSACSCKLYHKLLKGGDTPRRCPECVAEDEAERS